MYNFNHYMAVTNRHLCSGNYLNQIKKIAKLHPNALILREKDLTLAEYAILAKQVIKICSEENVSLFIHSYIEIAKELECKKIHFSLHSLKENAKNLSYFNEISVSCHSLKDIDEAIGYGATRLLLGNIFETDCKKGLPGKGLDFLKKACSYSPVPIYAIGGITPQNIHSVLNAGAKGGCMMSGFMKI